MPKRPFPVRTAGLFLACAMLLTSCGFGRSEPRETPTPVPLRYVSLNETAGEALLIQQYEAANPHVEIRSEGYSQLPADYLTGGDPPDLMLITPGYFLDSAIVTGQVLDLSDLWEQSGLYQVYPPGLSNLSEYNGKQYFLPLGYGWTGLYYNRQVFDQYGIAPPQNWEELLLVADTLLNNGVIPFAVAGEDEWLTSLWFNYLNYRLNGPEFHRDLLEGRVSYTDPRVRSVLETWIWMLDQGYFTPNANSVDTFTALLSTIRGDQGEVVRDKAAMILASPTFLEELPESFRNELDFVRFPVIDPSLPVGEVVIATGFMVPQEAPHRDEAMAFLESLASGEGWNMLAQDSSGDDFIPAWLQPDDEMSPAMSKGFAIVGAADAVDAAYILSVPLPMQSSFGRAMQTILSAQRTSADVDLDALLQQLEQASRTSRE